MKLNSYLPLMVLVVLGAFIWGTTFFSSTAVTTSTSSQDDTAFLTYHSKVCTYSQRAGSDGWIQNDDCHHNLFTAQGMNFTMRQISGVIVGDTNSSIGSAGIRVVAISNKTGTQCGGPQSQDNITLCGEYACCGLSRITADAVRLNQTGTFPTAGNWTITAQFTNTGSAALDVNSTGLFNTTTVNQTGQEVFFAQTTFTTATLQVNDKINVTWFLWVT